MRWKNKKIPQEGDIRNRFKFAFRPTAVDDYTVWLEWYSVKEKYTKIERKEIQYPKPRLQTVYDYGWVEIDRGLCYYV